MENKVNITQHSSLGTVWCAGWLFSIGFLNPGFWQGLLGLLIWPYFLGAHFAGVAG